MAALQHHGAWGIYPCLVGGALPLAVGYSLQATHGQRSYSLLTCVECVCRGASVQAACSPSKTSFTLRRKPGGLAHAQSDAFTPSTETPRHRRAETQWHCAPLHPHPPNRWNPWRLVSWPIRVRHPIPPSVPHRPVPVTLCLWVRQRRAWQLLHRARRRRGGLELCLGKLRKRTRTKSAIQRY